MSIAPKFLQRLTNHTSDVTSLDFFGSALLASGSSDKTVRLFRWNAGEGFVEDKNSPFVAHKYAVTKVQFSPKGHVLASSSIDGSIIFWDVNTGAKTDIIHQPNGEQIRNMEFSPDGNLLAAVDDAGTICIFGQDKMQKMVLKGIHEESVATLTFSKDSKIMLTACTMGNVRMFSCHDFDGDVLAESKLSIDGAHDMGVYAADFSRVIRTDPLDAKTKIYTLVTSGSDNMIKIWRVYCKTDVHYDGGESSSYGHSRLIPNSLQEHFSGTSTIYPTQLMNCECVLTILAHGSSVTTVKFNTTGTLIISGSLDRMVKIFDLQGNCLKTLDEHSRYVNNIAINIDSTIVASGSNDKEIHIWDLTGSYTLDSHLSNGLKSLLLNLHINEKEIPSDWICPITSEIMTDPVLCEDGFSYERSAISAWFLRDKRTSPMTNIEMSTTELKSNEKMRNEIENYLKKLDADPFE